MKEWTVGVIGGSGLYDMEGFEDREEVEVSTPFGDPSDAYIVGKMDGVKMVFLPRHGRGHRILPTELNYRANIYGMKMLGVEWIISIGACGSYKKELEPLHIVVPDQFFDRTSQARKVTFFGNGIVAHVGFADPVCPDLADVLVRAGQETGAQIHEGGTYLNMEGPTFSTRTESLLFKSWGMDVVGMTNMPEARLAREAEICYATLAMVTDYDCWHQDDDAETVTIEMIIDNVNKNAEASQKIIRRAIGMLPEARGCVCSSALKDAIITDRDAIPGEVLEELRPIIGKYMD
ncbi:S-methyl-5'-thioadenosine phosphorylase [Thermodesulfobacteriota bacterium]